MSIEVRYFVLELAKNTSDSDYETVNEICISGYNQPSERQAEVFLRTYASLFDLESTDYDFVADVKPV